MSTATPHIISSLFPIPSNDCIAFISDRDGNAELYLMNTNGQNQVRIIESDASENHPAWSPDGRYLAYSRCPPSGIMHWCATSYLCVLDMRSGEEVILEEWDSDRGIYDVWWTQGGECLAYECSGGIREVVSPLHSSAHCKSSDANAAWSPDGQFLARIIQRGDPSQSTLVVYGNDNPEPKPLSAEMNVYPWGISWSPDSEWVAFSSAVSGDDNLDIYIVNVKTGELRRLTTRPAGDYEPAWSPVR
jgi:TolB protein